MYKAFWKRLFDLVIGFIIIVLATPLFVITWLILFVENEGSVFFVQKRPGFQERAFKLVKFKTMTDARDKEGNLLPDIQRITRSGKLIRKLSLDELPQLLNVVKGEMSLIGPRPLLFKYLHLYNDTQRRRHSVRPGITGWAQVNGRNSISWADKFKYDIEYVNNLSFTFDLKILWLTMIKVLKREGVNQSDDRPMQPFNGSN